MHEQRAVKRLHRQRAEEHERTQPEARGGAAVAVAAIALDLKGRFHAQASERAR